MIWSGKKILLKNDDNIRINRDSISRSFYFLEVIALMVFLVVCLMWDPVQNPELSAVAEIVEVVCHSILIGCFIVRAL